MGKRLPYPELAVAFASAAWGLFWIPLRAFERHGLDPAWATLAQFISPLTVLLPFALVRRLRGKPTGGAQYRTGLLIGSAVALSLESLLLTNVARALILFYAMPVWGTILEMVFMRRQFTGRRGITLLLSLSGMLAILGQGDSLRLSMNLGDLMALVAGILFAFGVMRVRQAPAMPVFEQLFAFFLFGSLAALALSFLPIAALGKPPTASQLIAFMPLLLLVAAGFLIPVMWGIYWGSRHIDPGRLGFLLQIETVVGVCSAALFAAEPFGLHQAIGGALVISAGLVEVIVKQDSASAKAR